MRAEATDELDSRGKVAPFARRPSLSYPDLGLIDYVMEP
jgi:hypothetical protein